MTIHRNLIPPYSGRYFDDGTVQKSGMNADKRKTSDRCHIAIIIIIIIIGTL